MRLDNERPSANVEDQRGQGGLSNQGGSGRRFGFPGGSGGMPIGTGRGGISISSILLLVVAYLALKFIFGLDLMDLINGRTFQQPSSTTRSEIHSPAAPVSEAN